VGKGEETTAQNLATTRRVGHYVTVTSLRHRSLCLYLCGNAPYLALIIFRLLSNHVATLKIETEILTS
jgi:hypothetical protein